MTIIDGGSIRIHPLEDSMLTANDTKPRESSINPQERLLRNGLFEMVQIVATQMGEYSCSLFEGVYFTFNELGSNRKFIFQRSGLKATIEVLRVVLKPDEILNYRYGEYIQPVGALVEINGKKVFQEKRDFPSYFGELVPKNRSFVQIYESGAWEAQLQDFYMQALHLKAGREARRHSLRQRIRAAGDKRSASIF